MARKHACNHSYEAASSILNLANILIYHFSLQWNQYQKAICDKLLHEFCRWFLYWFRRGRENFLAQLVKSFWSFWGLFPDPQRRECAKQFV